MRREVTMNIDLAAQDGKREVTAIQPDWSDER
jgi:hypothetical protein